LGAARAEDTAVDAVKLLAEAKSDRLADVLVSAKMRYPSLALQLDQAAHNDPVRDLWREGKVKREEKKLLFSFVKEAQLWLASEPKNLPQGREVQKKDFCFVDEQ
jgi:hypothetical protein